MGSCSSSRIQMLRFGAVPNSKSSNGRKITRMARNLTILGPNRSRRRGLKFENFSNEQTNDLYKNFSKIFRNFRRDPRNPTKPGFELSFWICVEAWLVRSWRVRDKLGFNSTDF